MIAALPGLSNFTDFEPFRRDGLDVWVAHRPPRADPVAFVLPGTRNVDAASRFLRRSGFAEALRAAPRRRVPVIAVCGGAQLLGLGIRDPHRLESPSGGVPGLGILPFRTILRREKTLARRRFRHAASGAWLTGVEIRHGESAGFPRRPMFRSNGWAEGDLDPRGFFCTFLHGLFESDRFRRWFDRRFLRFEPEPRRAPSIGALSRRFELTFDLDPILAALGVPR